jgi:hypothetical protein
MTAQGYTITSGFQANGKTANGYPIYSGSMTKDGIHYAATIVQADSLTHAMTEFSESISNVKQMGYTGDNTSSTQWVGTRSYQGTTLGASVTLSDSYAVITVFGSQ